MTEELEIMARAKDPDQVKSKSKALVALFPYAVRWERGGGRRMVDAYFDIFMVPEARRLVAEKIVLRLDEASPNSPNWVVTLMLPYAEWRSRCNPNIVTGWAGAALAVQYTEKVGQNVVDALLRIASDSSLQPFIPVDIWVLLKKRPSLPPKCDGLMKGTQGRVVRRIREIGDIELLESYFLLVWAECHWVYDTGLTEMCTSIREDFGGIGMGHHRDVLIKHLDHVLGQLDMGLERLKQHHPSLNGSRYREAKRQYRAIKAKLLEADEKALEILASTPFRLTNLFGLLTPTNVHRIPLDVQLRDPSPVSVVARPQHLPPRPPNSILLSHTGSPPPPLRTPSIITQLLKTCVSRYPRREKYAALHPR